MPQSNHEHITSVLHYAIALQPSRILDVGVGNGAYGLLLRQYLDISAERVHPSTWQVRIDGVEIFDDYRNPIWEFAYNNVFLGDIRTLIDSVDRYDLVLFNDVLEHVELKEAQDLVNKALVKAKAVIITTPNRDMPQGAWGGNEAETHLCLLKGEHLSNLVAWEFTGTTNCYVCSRDPKAIEQLREARRTSLVGNPIRTFLRRVKWKLRG